MFFLFLCAIAPVFLILRWIDRQDLHPEPRRVVWSTFLLGALTAAPVYFAELGAGDLLTDLLAPLHLSTVAHTAVTTLLGVALPEELARFAVLFFYVRRNRAFDEPMDGLVYGAAAALGFAGVENVLYVVDGGFGTAVMRGLLSVPGHAFDGMLMGALLGAGLVRPQHRGRLTLLALALPTLCHALFDLPLLLGLTPFLTGVAPSWTTVAVGCALAPLPVLVTTLQWNTVRDLAARLRRSQHAALSGEHAERPLIPVLGVFLDGVLGWMERVGLRTLLRLGVSLGALSGVLLGVLALLFGVISVECPELLADVWRDAARDPDVPRGLIALGSEGCTRTLCLLLSATAVANLSIAVGASRIARLLARPTA